MDLQKLVASLLNVEKKSNPHKSKSPMHHTSPTHDVSKQENGKVYLPPLCQLLEITLNRLLSGQHLNSETCRQQDEKSMDALFFFTRTTFQNLLCFQSPLNKSYHSLFLPSWNKQSISSFFNKMWFLLHRSLCLENCPLHSVKN